MKTKSASISTIIKDIFFNEEGIYSFVVNQNDGSALLSYVLGGNNAVFHVATMDGFLLVRNSIGHSVVIEKAIELMEGQDKHGVIVL